jgi:hypothetical protein
MTGGAGTAGAAAGTAGNGGAGGNAGAAGNGGAGNGGAGAGGSSASSGSVGASGGSGTIGCMPDLVIDDMEDGDDFNCPNHGLHGDWWSSKDPASSSITPAEGTQFQAYPLGNDARTGSKYGMYLQGTGIGSGSASWAALGMNFVNKTPPTTSGAHTVPYDVSGFSGISFWAKSTLGNITVRMNIATVATLATSDGGTCVTNCADHWGHNEALNGSWQQFSRPFSMLAQSNSGTMEPEDLKHAMFLQFLYAGGSNPSTFEFLIDDVSFLPATP